MSPTPVAAPAAAAVSITSNSLFRRLLFLLGALMLAWPAVALEKVSVQLKWKHQFQFAGLYAAIEKGYFREAGFEVTLHEAVDGLDPVEVVLRGDADFGIAASELALHRARGRPVVALAVIVQNSPLVLLANRRKIPSIDALADQRIMLLPSESELFAYLRREGVKQFTAVPHSFDSRDLIEGRVDAISGYATDEPFELKQVGFPYIAFTPKAAGISFYGDTLFTQARRVSDSPARVAAFRTAVLRGWRYALEHPDEISDLILQRYSTRHSKSHLLFEAMELKRLMQPEMIELGQQSAAHWQQIAQTYAELGMLPAAFSIDGLIYESEEKSLPAWVWPVIFGGGLVMLMIAIMAAYFARLNRRLESEVERRHRTEGALRDSEERYRRLAEQSQDVIWTLDLQTRRFTYVSPAIERVRGFTPAEVMAQPFEAALTPASAQQVAAMLESHLARLRSGDMSAVSAILEVDQPHRDGRIMRAEIVASFMFDENQQPTAILGVSRDITARQLAETQLRNANERLQQQLDEIGALQVALQEQAIRDSLTGCFNRRYLDETLERELSRARREGYPLALVILDLDHFKAINDTYGHLAGDEALRQLADTMHADIRHEDVLCRYGGEEFIILMPRMPLSIAAERAERWRLKIEAIRIAFGNFELSFTASAGVAAYPDHGKTPDQLTHAADQALYQAKETGRNRIVVCED